MFISLFQTFSVLKLLLPYVAGYYSRSHEKKSMQIKHLCGYAQMYFLETAFSPHTRSYSFLFPSFFYGLYTALSFYLCYNFVKSNCIKKESARADSFLCKLIYDNLTKISFFCIDNLPCSRTRRGRHRGCQIDLGFGSSHSSQKIPVISG